MNKRALLYERVSLEIQTKNDAVSIDEQQADMEAHCNRNGWEIVGVFKDYENYRATLPPNKGMIVNPSGERADHPQFLAMLEQIKTGEVDAVICWRDDRLVRHPRVGVALEDALDLGDKARNGRGPVRIYDATGGEIERFTLSIKASVWREENKRRAERSRMGKVGSLKDGHWPGEYRRYGYKSVKIQGKSGREIQLDPETAPIVRRIFELYDAGKPVSKIRKMLISEAKPQIYLSLVKHDWSLPLIQRILRSSAYLGKATWKFEDGSTTIIDIPPIIEQELWQRVQKRLDRNKVVSPRNAKGVYLVQQLLYCGDCGRMMSVARGGKCGYSGGYGYRCSAAYQNPHEGHRKPNGHNGRNLDEAIWRKIVDHGLKRPDIVLGQIELKIRKLQEESDDIAGEMVRAQNRVNEIEGERIFYQRQAARGKITEEEFDRQLDETAEQLEYWRDELERLRSMMHDADKVSRSLDYAEALFAKLRENLDYLDCDRETLEGLTEPERNNILKSRRAIIRALVDRVTINADRRVDIEGVFDGSEAAQFELRGSFQQL